MDAFIIKIETPCRTQTGLLVIDCSCPRMISLYQNYLLALLGIGHAIPTLWRHLMFTSAGLKLAPVQFLLQSTARPALN